MRITARDQNTQQKKRVAFRFYVAHQPAFLKRFGYGDQANRELKE